MAQGKKPMDLGVDDDDLFRLGNAPLGPNPIVQETGLAGASLVGSPGRCDGGLPSEVPGLRLGTAGLDNFNSLSSSGAFQADAQGRGGTGKGRRGPYEDGIPEGVSSFFVVNYPAPRNGRRGFCRSACRRWRFAGSFNMQAILAAIQTVNANVDSRFTTLRGQFAELKVGLVGAPSTLGGSLSFGGF